MRNRITELRTVKAKDLRPNPRNWRTHPDEQATALRQSIAAIGFIDAPIVRETDDGSLELVDGHLRAEIDPEAEIKVAVTDLTQDEANRALAILDPIVGMAGANREELDALLDEMEQDDELRALAENIGEMYELRVTQEDEEERNIDHEETVATKKISFDCEADHHSNVLAMIRRLARRWECPESDAIIRAIALADKADA